MTNDDLIPPDYEQCQAMLPRGPTFMYLGPPPPPQRCANKPTVLVMEVKPGKDGKIGSMTLCPVCYDRFLKAFGPGYATTTPIIHRVKPRGGTRRSRRS